MAFWQVFLILNIFAAGFVLWPTLFFSKRHRQELRSNSHTESNEEVYQDHVKEMEQTLNRGEINSDELAQLKKDLERTIIEETSMGGEELDRPIISSFKSRIPVLVLVFLLPILSLAIYTQLGAKQDWDIFQAARARVQAPVAQVPELSTELIQSLQVRVKQKPQNAQNWYLLASTAIEQGQFEEAVRAYREVLTIEPNTPKVKAELAQALFLRAGNTITPEVRSHINEVLAVAPNLATALGLAGIDAYRTGRYQEAISYWQKAVIQLDPNSEAALALNGGIARANIALAETGEGTPVESGPSVMVSVSLGKGVEVNKDAAVFIYARAWQGPPMPLAIKKVRAADLPLKVSLDKTMSMMQGMDLSAFPEIEVLARISQTGSATAQPGDWQASLGPVIVASQKDTIKLVISEQLP
ncbi:MAG: c-type cytochrome biogenesis protein CcmI [Agarilytica sp.]